jgi:hypothetical protein
MGNLQRKGHGLQLQNGSSGLAPKGSIGAKQT